MQFIDSRFDYTPFDNDISETTSGDLEVLREVAEGWYVDYKEALTSQKSIAKGISSFANSYGGWLFYGIREDRATRCPAEFVGLSGEESGIAEARIRQAVSEFLSPIPFFQTKRVKLPSIDHASEERCIVLVHIPASLDAPHIHRDGRVYRRVGDSSEPGAEIDRHFLDNLSRRRNQAYRSLASHIEYSQNLSEGEKELSYFQLYLFPTLITRRNIKHILEFDQFKEIMSNQERDGVPCDNFFLSANGYVARQVYDREETKLSFSFDMSLNGNCEIILPFSSCKIADEDNLHTILSRYKYGNAFIEYYNKTSGSWGTLLDITQLFGAIQAALSAYHIFLEKMELPLTYFMKGKLVNMWRRVPYIDLKKYVLFIHENRLPYIADEELYVPPGLEPTSFEWCGEDDFRKGEKVEGVRATRMMIDVCRCLGLPGELLSGEDVGHLFSTRVLRPLGDGI